MHNCYMKGRDRSRPCWCIMAPTLQICVLLHVLDYYPAECDSKNIHNQVEDCRTAQAACSLIVSLRCANKSSVSIGLVLATSKFISPPSVSNKYSRSSECDVGCGRACLPHHLERLRSANTLPQIRPAPSTTPIHIFIELPVTSKTMTSETWEIQNRHISIDAEQHLASCTMGGKPSMPMSSLITLYFGWHLSFLG